VFKDLPGLGALWKQAQEARSRMQGMAEELRNRRATGSAGGGLVEVEVNGLVEVIRCRIDPTLVAQQDRELLEDLVAAAMNQAVVKAKQLHADLMKSITGGMPIPGLEEMMGKFLNPGPETTDPGPKQGS
jgi:DNA-binding YbaB/EbfC family protein